MTKRKVVVLTSAGILSVVLLFLPLFPSKPNLEAPRSDMLVQKGDAFVERNDFDSAISAYTDAAIIEPRNARLYYLRGIAYNRKGDFPAAMQDFNEAIRLDPRDCEAYEWRGINREDMGELDAAIADYTIAIRIQPLASIYLFRGIAYKKKGNLGEAVADFTEAIRIDPEEVAREAYAWRASVSEAKGDLSSAIADYNRAILLDPTRAEGFYSRALTYEKLGDSANAKRDFAEAKRLGFSLTKADNGKKKAGNEARGTGRGVSPNTNK